MLRPTTLQRLSRSRLTGEMVARSGAPQRLQPMLGTRCPSLRAPHDSPHGPREQAHEEALADDRRTGKLVNLTAYRRFGRDTEVLLYHDRDSRVIEVRADDLDLHHALPAEYRLNVRRHHSRCANDLHSTSSLCPIGIGLWECGWLRFTEVGQTILRDRVS
jgi:hypothetical protein